MLTAPPPDSRRGLKQLLFFACLLLDTGCILYSGYTQTGLGGWLIALQIRFFGHATDWLTIWGAAWGLLW